MLWRPDPLSGFMPLQQSDLYARLLTALGRRVTVTDTDVARLVRIDRGGIGWSGGGPVWRTEEREARAAFLREHGPTILTGPLADADLLRGAGYLRIARPRSRAVLSLQGARPRGTWRRAARDGARLGAELRLRPFDAARDADLLDAERAQRRARGYRGHPAAFLRALAQIAPGDVLTASAWAGRERIAGMVVICHGPSATWQLGWSGAEGRRHAAHHRLILMLRERLAERGIRHLDLGRIDAGAPGIARFKTGSGAVPQTDAGTWVRLPFRR